MKIVYAVMIVFGIVVTAVLVINKNLLFARR